MEKKINSGHESHFWSLTFFVKNPNAVCTVNLLKTAANQYFFLDDVPEESQELLVTTKISWVLDTKIFPADLATFNVKLYNKAGTLLDERNGDISKQTEEFEIDGRVHKIIFNADETVQTIIWVQELLDGDWKRIMFNCEE